MRHLFGSAAFWRRSPVTGRTSRCTRSWKRSRGRTISSRPASSRRSGSTAASWGRRTLTELLPTLARVSGFRASAVILASVLMEAWNCGFRRVRSATERAEDPHAACFGIRLRGRFRWHPVPVEVWTRHRKLGAVRTGRAHVDCPGAHPTQRPGSHRSPPHLRAHPRVRLGALPVNR